MVDKSFFENALKLIEEKVIDEPISQQSLAFLFEFHIPEEVTSFMKKYSFTQDTIFNRVYFDKVNKLPDTNLWEENKRCISEGLLIIGSGLNGDFIVIDINSLKVGYVFSSEIYENEEAIVRENFVSLNCSIGEFFYNAITKENFPVDGFEAKEY